PFFRKPRAIAAAAWSDACKPLSRLGNGPGPQAGTVAFSSAFADEGADAVSTFQNTVLGEPPPTLPCPRCPPNRYLNSLHPPKPRHGRAVGASSRPRAAWPR